VPKSKLAVKQECFPLDLYFCRDCTHVQLLDVVDSSLLFEHYVYVSGTSPSYVRHLEEYADTVSRFVGLREGELVVEIGSNDGTLIEAFKRNHGATTLGIDPARNLVEAATAKGIETIPAFFTSALSAELAEERGRARVIAANNVFAHIDDLDDVVDGVRALLAPDGIFVFEVSYLLDVVDKVLFDTIYHEHLSYHAVSPLVTFFQAHGLELIEVFHVPTHGGSLRGVVQHKGGRCRVGPSVARALALEVKGGLQELATYRTLSDRVNAIGHTLKQLLTRLRRQGRSIAGFGAPAKATTLMYHFGIGSEFIEFIADDSPLKQGMYTPGMHIPVLPAEALAERRPDYLLILAWNFAESIIAKNHAFREAGGRFILPLPQVEVV
jgi:SAM-dependent methyltransferase